MGYQDQWNRIQRWRRRLSGPPRDAVELDDFMWAFFQNCWHFKDWIKNDPQLPSATTNQVEALVNKERFLLICADLANGTKHFRLTTPRVGAAHSHRVLSVVAGEPSKTRISYFVALPDGTLLPAEDVADGAISDWKRILQGLGLSY